ncbi:helix-turn-helix domain-containing protein [uncultured Shewanella sp.]|uniref:AraC family transcriptional regulator n=1 Tax=uncultured Shewanella sp. TaxID=173975 RepID=UPI0026099C23|nr:helix-turn-helix domain-containing protein [uncultured Shewanella sp.]
MDKFTDIPDIKYRAPNKERSGIEVLDLDKFYSKLPKYDHDPSQPHRLHYFCFLYITQGEGSHFIDCNYYPVRQGSFIAVNKNQIQAFDLKNRPKGKMINVTEKFFDEIRANIRMPLFTPAHLATAHSPVFVLDQATKESCDLFLAEIDKEQASGSCDNLLLQLVFSSLLLKLSQKKTSHIEQLNEVQAQRFSQFISLIEKKFTITRDASVYADMIHISYKYLNQICKLACNQTAKQLIDAHIILEIKRRLTIDNSQVQQIAYDLGFDDVTYFVKFFKRHTLLTPSQFKETTKG